MSNFRSTDRQTGFLMPPSVDEWLPERHLARFVVEVVDRLDLKAMSKSYRGSGSASYHPGVLLGLLIVKSRPNATPFSRPIPTPFGVRNSVSGGAYPRSA